MAVISRLSDAQRESSRRSALGSIQGPTDQQQAAGGLPGGFYRTDPMDPTTPSFPFLRRMRRDHMIAMGRHFIDSDVLSAPWWMDGDDARVQAYADKLLRPIYVELALAYLRIMDFGYSDGVKNFKTVQPGWTYFEGGVAKKVWDNGPIDAIVYRDIIPLEPEDSQISFDDTGTYNGILYDPRYGGPGGSFIIDGKRTPSIDAVHGWWATEAKSQNANNPYGYPRIAHCAPIFWMYRWIWDLIARGFENSFDPGPVMRFPTEEAARTSADGTREEPRDAALRTGSKRRSGSTIALPSDQYKDIQEKATGVYKWSIDYPKNDTDFSAVMEFIGYLESAKLVGLYLPDQSLREGAGGSSSRNVVTNLSDQRASSQNVDIGQMQTWMMDTFVAPVIQMVFPLYSGELSIKSVGAGGQATDLLRQVFQLTGQQDFKRFGIDLRRLAESNNFPMLDPAEQEKELADAASAAAAAPPPVAPTQGRRALVTQTGFGEMSYHRIEQRKRGPIEFLSRDGDFVASLPRIDAFADATIVAHARDLRRSVECALTWAGRDLARHVARSQDLSHSDEVVRGWVPDAEVLDEHVRVVRDSLEDVVERAAGDGGVSRHGFDVRFWSDTRVAESISQALLSVREQGAEVVAESFAQGLSSRAAGQVVRATVDLSAQAVSQALGRLDAQRAYNYGVLRRGAADGVAFAQVVDECHGDRHGTIMPLGRALHHRVESPTCTMTVRLLPRAPEGLIVRRETLEHDLAMYDEETATILIDPAVDSQAESEYLLALGEKFRQ